MPLRVVELFAGVGGFRIGLEGPPGSSKDGNYAVVWSNQWEPSTKKQHAAEVYVERWGLTQSATSPLEFHGEGEVFINDDIAEIDADEIPDHDLIVGGFPCQDYSVARTSAKGLEGGKGVLWWQIHRIMSAKKPKYAMLENVDRLLKSPTSQRGRDFAVMLASLAELGYIVEWRVINAADYGMPQRRRRVFILAYASGTAQYEALKDESTIKQWIETDGTMAKAFPVKPLNVLMAIPKQIKQSDKSDLADVSDNFNKGANPKSKSPFKKSGILVGNNYYTYDTIPNYNGSRTNLSEVLLTPGKVPLEYVLEPDSVMKTKGWKYLKGAKDEPRKGRDDFTYSYKEGPMIFPDALDKPSRTIITGEGGSTPSRFKHVVKFKPTKKMTQQLELNPSIITNPYNDFFGKKIPASNSLRDEMVKQIKEYKSFKGHKDLDDNSQKIWTPHGENINNLKIYFGKPGALCGEPKKSYDKSNDMRCMVLSKPFGVPPKNRSGYEKNSDIGLKLYEILKNQPKSVVRDVFRLLSRMRKPSLDLDHEKKGGKIFWKPKKDIVDRILEINSELLYFLMLIEAIAINEDLIYLKKNEKEKPDYKRGREKFIAAIQLFVHSLLVTPQLIDSPMWKNYIRKFNGTEPDRILNNQLEPIMELSYDKEIRLIRQEFSLKDTDWLRRLTPIELERLNMFPDNHTAGPTDGKRAFFMGNALVIGIVEKLGKSLLGE